VLRRRGFRVFPGSGWEPFDALFTGSSVVQGWLVTSSYPEGTVQVRVRRQLRPRPLALWAAAVLAGAAFLPTLVAVAVGAIAVGELARGWWRTGPAALRTLRAATA
jgi:hypothetical protein